MRPLFIIGNKRSGTSQLVRSLNLHPEVFIAHESDIVWILHQFYQRLLFTAHEWNSDRGMKHTLAAAGHRLRRDQTPWENFQAVLTRLMEQGTPWLPPMQKPGLRWLGDKKPLLTGVFRFLGLTPADGVLKTAARRAYPIMASPAETLQMAGQHGYDPGKPAGWVRTFSEHWYWKLAKRLR